MYNVIDGLISDIANNDGKSLLKWENKKTNIAW